MSKKNLQNIDIFYAILRKEIEDQIKEEASKEMAEKKPPMGDLLNLFKDKLDQAIFAGEAIKKEK